MAPVTELAFITLKPGAHSKLSSKETPEGKAWSEALSTISKQEGFQRQRWGVTLEDESLLMLVIDWDSITSHQHFISTPSYAPFKSTLGKIMEGVHLFHIEPTPFPPRVLDQAPCVEFAVFYGGEEYGDLRGDMPKFVTALEEGREGIDGYKGEAWGQSKEEVIKHSEQGDDKAPAAAKAVALFIGWESKEKHMAFRETNLFKDNIHLIRGNHRGVEMWHVKFVVY